MVIYEWYLNLRQISQVYHSSTNSPCNLMRFGLEQIFDQNFIDDLKDFFYTSQK